MYASFAEVYDIIFPMSPSTLAFMQGFTGTTSRILEVGCGTGTLLQNIKAKHKVGLDIEPALMALAQSKKKTSEFEQLDYYCADLLDFGSNIPEASFDIIFSLGNVVSHLAPQQFINYVDEIHRILSPKGHWVFHTIHWDDHLAKIQYEYPPLCRGELVFERTYQNITPENLIFKTRLTQGSSLVFEQTQMLYPHTESTIKKMHNAFDLQDVWADYSKNPPQGISRVYHYIKP